MKNLDEEYITLQGIPALLYGKESPNLYLAIHGKYGSKDDFREFAKAAESYGFQTLAFDLPEHGDRKADSAYECTVWNGIRDLQTVMQYAQSRWETVSVYAVSLGAFFTLMAYQSETIQHCLLQSPVIDMEKLIQNMMKQDGISEQELLSKGKIPSSSNEILDWDYYQFVRKNPVTKWTPPTDILYGEYDNLTDRNTAETFAKTFGCHLTIAENCEHWFHTPEQLAVLDNWLDTSMKES